MSGVNPQGVVVSSFKVPSVEELDHDYLWRYAPAAAPARRDRDLQPLATTRRSSSSASTRSCSSGRSCRPDRPAPGIWKRRYREINDWERYLTDNGIKVVKLFLNVSKEEQRRRFLRRIDLADHNWKFSVADVRERQFWDDYQHAYSELLSHTSTEWAPWHVIPADRKWYARLAAGAVIRHAILELDPAVPGRPRRREGGAPGDEEGARGRGAARRAADPFGDGAAPRAEWMQSGTTGCQPAREQRDERAAA